jgi:predicted regulator of Ras-like GTPase activity (Roadblock/LC7/MglB family)
MNALASPLALFTPWLQPGQSAILVDHTGLVMAGTYPLSDGSDAAAELSAALSGICEESLRVTRHLAIGQWQAITFEAEAATVSLAPLDAGDRTSALLVVASAAELPLGALRRTAERCSGIASTWLSGDVAS